MQRTSWPLTLCALLAAGCSVPAPDHAGQGAAETVSPEGADHSAFALFPLDLALNVTGPAVPGAAVQPDDNCVALSISPRTAMVLNATAAWSAQSPLAQNLVLRAFDQTGRAAQNASGSPVRVHFAPNGTDGATVGLFVPNGGAAQGQAVRVHVDLFMVNPRGEEPLQVTRSYETCPG